MDISAKKYKGVFEHSNIGIALGDKDGRVADANPEMLRLLGYAEQELVNKDFSEIVRLAEPVYGGNLVAYMQDTDQEKCRVLGDLIKKTGETVWAELSVVARKNDEEGIESLTCMVLRVSEKRSAGIVFQDKGKLEFSPSFNLSGILYTYNIDDKEITYINQPKENRSDLLPEEIWDKGGHFAREVIHPEDYPAFKGHIKNILKLKNSETLALEYWAQASNGQWNWYRSEASVFLRNPNGNPREIIGTLTNITACKKKELQLKQFERFVENSFSGICIIGYNGEYIYTNNTYSEMLGYEANDELMGCSFMSHCADPHMFQYIINRLQKEEKLRVELVAKRKDDSRFDMVMYIHLEYDPEGNEMYCSTAMDISARKRKEAQHALNRENLERLVKERTHDLEQVNEELMASNEELSHKNEIIQAQNFYLIDTVNDLKNTQAQLVQSEKMASLGVLTAGIAHEINNPLNFIQGGFLGLETLLVEETQITGQAGAKFFDSIKVGLERAKAIVDGLNMFSRKNEDFGEDCNIHAIIGNCLMILNNKLKDHIKVVKQLNAHQYMVKGNVGKLHQVFLNVILNAAQAIPKKGAILISTYNQLQSLNIEIIDTGRGIGKENLAKLTDPFFTTKEPGQGTGLGLYISYNVIQEHHGSIEFRSKLNKGTTVLIKLPM